MFRPLWGGTAHTAGTPASARWALERRGWRTLGSVSGKTAAECERRFFEAWLPGQPIIAPRADEVEAALKEVGFSRLEKREQDGELRGEIQERWAAFVFQS